MKTMSPSQALDLFTSDLDKFVEQNDGKVLRHLLHQPIGAFPFLDRGASRSVYRFSNYVIKLAYNTSGLGQNKQELIAYNRYKNGPLAKTYGNLAHFGIDDMISIQDYYKSSFEYFIEEFEWGKHRIFGKPNCTLDESIITIKSMKVPEVDEHAKLFNKILTTAVSQLREEEEAKKNGAQDDPIPVLALNRSLTKCMLDSFLADYMESSFDLDAGNIGVETEDGKFKGFRIIDSGFIEELSDVISNSEDLLISGDELEKVSRIDNDY